MKTTNILLGVLAGAAVGAIAGVLLAPHKGSKTRKLIVDKGEEYVDDLKEKLSDLSDVISDKYNGITDDAKHIIAKGSAKIETITKELKEVMG
jgi:gas vesicle protein